MELNKEMLIRIENKIILAGFERSLIPCQEDKVIPLRAGRLSSTPFGLFLGKEFEYDSLLAINFYGHFKLSSKIIKAVESVKHIFHGIRSIKAQIIHFNSIRTEAAKEIAGNDKQLFIDYVEFKRGLLDLRFGTGRNKGLGNKT